MGDDATHRDAAPEGGPPGSDPHLNRPGLTNGIPDGVSDEAATAVPDSDRKGAETATDAGSNS